MKLVSMATDNIKDKGEISRLVHKLEPVIPIIDAIGEQMLLAFRIIRASALSDGLTLNKYLPISTARWHQQTVLPVS